MPEPKEKPIAFRFKSADTKAKFAAYMAANSLNANQAANQLIAVGLAAASSPVRLKDDLKVRLPSVYLSGDESGLQGSAEPPPVPIPDHVLPETVIPRARKEVEKFYPSGPASARAEALAQRQAAEEERTRGWFTPKGGKK